MRTPAASIAFAALTFAASALAQSDRDFSGQWIFDAARSELRGAAPPARSLEVKQSGASLIVSTNLADGSTAKLTYPLNGKPERSQDGDGAVSTLTKWEGAALLVNMNVSGLESYSLSERWSRAANGERLTIERTVNVRGRESESVLVYVRSVGLNNSSASPEPAVEPERAAPVRTLAREIDPVAPPVSWRVPNGSRILTRLTNAVDTRHTAVGDRLYLQTAVPVFIQGRLVIPQGSFVTATVTEAVRAGKVKGKSGLNLRFESLTLPNGVSRDFRARAGSVDTKGTLDRTEGRIEGESNKGGDARTVATTTAAGTGLGAVIGSAAGHVGAGAGIGAAAGALGGLAGVLGSRGPDVVLPAGTTMEMVLDRELQYTDNELGRIR